MVASIRVEPIQETDLPVVSAFLHENLSQRFTPEAWRNALIHPWSEQRPNFGVQMRDGDKLVGVLCAIYSDQTIGGRTEKFCNPHSWCVLKDYRNHGIGLVLSIVKQQGYHFTMLTPNPKVAQIFRGLRFRDLGTPTVTFPNLPAPLAALSGTFAESSTQRIAERLAEPVRRDFELHREIPWLTFVAFGRGTDVCLVAFKRIRWKRMPCAWLMHVSDPEAFDRHVGTLRNHLLFRHGLLVSYVEKRFLSRAPRVAYHGTRTQAKLYLSRELKDTQIRDLYSELVALDV
jgi:hypothetical protein